MVVCRDSSSGIDDGKHECHVVFALQLLFDCSTSTLVGQVRGELGLGARFFASISHAPLHTWATSRAER
jgi:hypothetical protein